MKFLQLSSGGFVSQVRFIPPFGRFERDYINSNVAVYAQVC